MRRLSRIWRIAMFERILSRRFVTAMVTGVALALFGTSAAVRQLPRRCAIAGRSEGRGQRRRSRKPSGEAGQNAAAAEILHGARDRSGDELCPCQVVVPPDASTGRRLRADARPVENQTRPNRVRHGLRQWFLFAQAREARRRKWRSAGRRHPARDAHDAQGKGARGGRQKHPPGARHHCRSRSCQPAASI